MKLSGCFAEKGLCLGAPTEGIAAHSFVKGAAEQLNIAPVYFPQGESAVNHGAASAHQIQGPVKRLLFKGRERFAFHQGKTHEPGNPVVKIAAVQNPRGNPDAPP